MGRGVILTIPFWPHTTFWKGQPMKTKIILAALGLVAVLGGRLLGEGGAAGRRRGPRAGKTPQTAGASSASAPGPLVQLAPAAAIITATIAAASRSVSRCDSTSQPASAATAGSMLSRTP